jgi:ABC-2 type transport system ATP-binding protein
MPILEADGLTKWFGDRTVVDQLTFSVEPGEALGLLGPNGADKSTTLKMLVTLLPPSARTARVAGFDIVGEPAAVRRAIGYVPQLLSSDGVLTGYENLLVFAKLYDVPRAVRPFRIGGQARTAWPSANRFSDSYGHRAGGSVRRVTCSPVGPRSWSK